ncbi:NAD(P)-binding protein [Westerdykella ornata]|uniref:NAD(P)-binding protein n=1 Tax=Westerdykella ornata TaxID=318751 RepID=A0A6A6J6I5_WESOR|nr:NAD(P)-binding protein [Westerdykella ornata]KAF2271817.1 NAD(P)-binding protein [Westerdykella ornata]
MAEKVIILTGASRGIGQAIAQYLLSRNHKLVVISRTLSALDQLRSQYPDHVEVLAGDLSDLSLGPKAVELAVTRWDRLDGVIVNHGTLNPVKKVADSSAEEWRKSFDVNVFSALSIITPAIPHLRRTHGRIILTSSGASLNAYQSWGAYGASKAVLNHLALTLAVEEPDITTVSVRPGVVDTEMQREIREKHRDAMSAKDAEKFAGLKSRGVLLRPEQPGHVIARLAVEAAKELSGRFVNWNDESLGPLRGE